VISLYPDTRIFKAALWDYLSLNSGLTESINFSQQHPKKSSEIQNGKTRIVLTPTNNYGFGEKLTRHISAPTIRFTAYATREASCDDSIQKLIEVLESWTPDRFQMIDQHLQFINPDQRIESLFNEDINLYFGSITYKFHLSR
jgi:hypothetical protein